MSTERKFLLKEETYSIIGCAIEVLNTLGYGLMEKPYENALVVEFGLRDIPVEQQKAFEIIYKDVKVGRYVPDLVAYEKVIIEVKTVDRISDWERGQLLNYLKISGLRVGLVLNFKYSKLEWERLVL